MCAEPTEGTDTAEGRVTTGCQWREVEENDEASEKYQRECKRSMESLPWRWHYRMKEEWIIYTRVSYVCVLVTAFGDWQRFTLELGKLRTNNEVEVLKSL